MRDSFHFFYCIGAVLFLLRWTSWLKISQGKYPTIICKREFQANTSVRYSNARKTNSTSNVYRLENTQLVSAYHNRNRKRRLKIDFLRPLENKTSFLFYKKLHVCFIFFQSVEMEAKQRDNFPILPKLLSADSPTEFQRTCTVLREQRPTRDSNAYRVTIHRISWGQNAEMYFCCIC